MNTMESTQSMGFPSKAIEAALFRALSSAQGRHDALQFAWDCGADTVRLSTEIHEQQELVISLQDGPMAPGASPRIYKDEYLQALREVLNMVAALAS